VCVRCVCAGVCVCVCVCVCACVCVCVFVFRCVSTALLVQEPSCVRVRVHVCVCVCVSGCVFLCLKFDSLAGWRKLINWPIFVGRVPQISQES